MCGSTNNGLIDEVGIQIILLCIIRCKSEIRILLMIKCRKLQANTFILLLREYIADLCKTLVSFYINSKSIMISRELIIIRVIHRFPTCSRIIQDFKSKLCYKTFAIFILPAIKYTKLI